MGRPVRPSSGCYRISVTETVNLANARAGHHVAVRILDLMEQTSGVRIEWVGSLRFEAAKARSIAAMPIIAIHSPIAQASS